MREQILAWDRILDASTYYEILGVGAESEAAEVKQAFHTFALAFHPDQHPGVDDEIAGALRRIFQRGTEGYRILTHPEWRLRYDWALSQGRRRLEPSEMVQTGSGQSGSKRLDELCRSAGAKLCAHKADKLIGAGDLHGAKRELVQALQYDGNANRELAERLAALELVLFAMGTED